MVGLKRCFLMCFIVMIVLTIIGFTEEQNLSAISKEDVFKELKVNDAKDSSAVFSMNSPSSLDMDKLSFTFNEVCGKVKGYTVSVLDVCYKDVTHYKNTIEEKCSNANETYSCSNITNFVIDYIESVPYSCFKEINSIPSGIKDYKINADIEMAVCSDGKLGYRIDWIPSLEIDTDKILAMSDWAWWNASYQYKMLINQSLMSAGIPFYINGSNGVNINGINLVVLATSTSGNLGLYFNNQTDYAIIENDSYIQSFSISGLTAYWKLDEASGTIAKNEINEAYNGTISGTSVGIFGKIGRSVNFTGVSGDKIDVGNMNSFDDFSVSVWFKKSTAVITGNNQALFGSQSGSPNKMIRIDLLGSSDDRIVFATEYDNDNWLFNYTVNTIKDTNWHNVVVTRSGAIQNIYLDGISQSTTYNKGGTMSGRTINTGTTYQIGQVAGAGQYFSGIIDDVGVWNKVLTSSDINSMYLNVNFTIGYGNVYAFEENSAADETQGRTAIEEGVVSSSLSSYEIATDRKVQIRLLNGSQYSGTFDKLVSSGSKRFALNYDQNSTTGFPLFYSILPVFYVWQYADMTPSEITADVTDFIDSNN